MIAANCSLLQATISVGFVTVEVGLTVILKVCGVPLQLFAFGVTVIFAEIGALLVFFAVNVGILLFPEVPNPIAALSFVQL